MNERAYRQRSHFLPRRIAPKAPPIKMQGIKTKVVPLIARSIQWSGVGTWIEPFCGSGAVALNIAPHNAILADTNTHVVRVLNAIKDGEINTRSVRNFLEREGSALLDKGERHYYFVRERFNERGDPLDFLFLNRSCFNGMMRFNKTGQFNVPFCRKPERFRPALITKIVNQVDWASQVMANKNWHIVVQDWKTTLAEANEGDMIYCDPPYVGRHTDYYNGFTDQEANDLAQALINTPAEFALSMWLENKYRRNHYVDRWFSNYPQRSMRHFYHVGSLESLRNDMTEAVILSKGAAA